MRGWRLVFSCVIVAILLTFLGLSCVSTPVSAPSVSPEIASRAVGIGAVDALADLKTQVFSLPKTAFEDESQRDRLVAEIDAAIAKVKDGDYKGTLGKLEGAVKGSIRKWVPAPYQEKLLEASDIAIACVINASQTTIETAYGKLAGADGGNDSWVWKGVPYAKPPVGELRWRSPQDPEPWQGVRHSTNKFSVATQPLMSVQGVPANRVVGSEDCLYLNVFRPKGEAKDLPVLVWIHGGGNAYGGAEPYDASKMASQCNMVVVVIQYRLGPFGWFVHPTLNAGGSPEDRSGNYGTLDTIQALKWVKENIAAFGGDPNNVTVGGQSAGGFNTMNILISPLAKGLFHRALVMSAGGWLITLEEGIARTNAMIDKMLVADGTCNDAEEAAKYRASMSPEKLTAYLRGKSAEEVMRAAMSPRGTVDRVSPFIDGTVIPGKAIDVIASGNYNRVPIILGSTADELKLFMPLYGTAIKTSTGRTWADAFKVMSGTLKLDEVFGPEDKAIYDACGKYPSLSWKATMVDSVARALKEKQDGVYCYFFRWGEPGSGPEPLDFIYGAAHILDIPFFFGGERDPFNLGFFTEANRAGRVALQRTMMAYLANFARSGNPNGAGLPEWKQWSNEPGGPKSIIFDATFNEAKVTMGDWEVTKKQVMAEIDALPLPPQSKTVIKMFVFF